MYRGLRIAKISVPASKVFVTDDLPRKVAQSSSRKWWCIGGFIPLQSSRRLSYFRSFQSGNLDVDSIDDSDGLNLRMRLDKMSQLAKLERVQVPVLVLHNGDVLVVNGNHRVIALFARDGSLDNVQFFVTL